MSFIMLDRKFFKHPLWLEDREYSRAEAWLDLVRMAAWKPNRELVGGHMIEVPVGSIIASERFLGKRWRWGRQKCRSYLKLLEGEKMIERKETQGQTIVSLLKYDTYNNPALANNPPITPPQPTPNPRPTQTIEVEEGEERKKKTTSSASTQTSWSKAGGWEGITYEIRSKWAEAYPACNLDRQLSQMSEWLTANPTKAKKSNWYRFATNWLKREQDRGGDAGRNIGGITPPPPPKPKPAIPTDFIWQHMSHFYDPGQLEKMRVTSESTLRDLPLCDQDDVIAAFTARP